MKSASLTSCVLGAALLLTGCSGASKETLEAELPSATASERPSESAEQPRDRPASAAASVPTGEVAGTVELEARMSGLTDALGAPLQIVPLEDAEVGLVAAETFFESADIEPAQCEGMVADGMALARSKATAGLMGMGEADTAGGVLLLALLDGSTEESVSQSFDFDRGRLERCSPLTFTVAETTTTLFSDELPQDLIGEESYALLATEKNEAGEPTYTLTVTARGNGVIAFVQSVSTVEPDGILQDDLAELAAQALEPAGS